MNIIKNVFFPHVEEEVKRHVDKTSLDNIWRTCLVILVFESVSLLVFVLTRRVFDHAAWVSIGSASFCVASCLIGALCSGKMRKVEELSHLPVVVFNSCYYLLLSLWAVHVSYRNYCNNEQILTFFAVELMMVCFVPLKPVISVIFATAIYIIMYATMYSVDGAKGINIFNYILLLLVTITGMIVRYHSQVATSEKSLELEQSNDYLFNKNRHDGLTGLRNRRALEEDVPKIIKKHVNAYMIDVNYFKEINDTYGHALGDSVLKETARWLKTVFKADRCYRYGGDEFLILGAGRESYKEDTFSFSPSEMPDVKVLLSIGRADGDPKDRDELFELIAQADEVLYEIKQRTHSPEYGGHGERI